MTKNNFHMFVFLLTIIVTSACVTTYDGPTPDFSLNNQQAKNEFSKFRFDDGFFSNGTEVITMGQDKKHYTMDSLRPIIAKVSNGAQKKFKKAKTWERAGHFLLAVALGIFIAEASGPSEDSFKSNVSEFYYGFLGGSIASSLISIGYTNSAVKTYNNDLETKLLPKEQSVGLNFSVQY